MSSLESLVLKAQKESVLEEEVVATIQKNSDFYTRLFTGDLRTRRIVRPLLTDSVFLTTKDQLRSSLTTYLGITHLDDITPTHASKRLGNLLDFTPYHPYEFRSRLVTLGVFSLDLKEYEPVVRETIFQNQLYDEHVGKRVSTYFSPHLESTLLEENRRLLVLSDAFKNYLLREGIQSLDDITKNEDGHSNATRKLGTLLGFQTNCPLEFRSRLVNFGLFSLNLEEYDPLVREHIFEKILFSASQGKRTSAYFSLGLESTLLEDNRKSLVRSDAFKNYLLREGIQSLDHIIWKHATQILGTTLDFKTHGPLDFKSRLINLGVFSLALRNYSPLIREEIITINILKFESAIFIWRRNLSC